MKIKLLNKMRRKSFGRYELVILDFMFYINRVGSLGWRTPILQRKGGRIWYTVDHGKGQKEVDKHRREWIIKKVQRMKQIRNAFALS